MKFAIPIMKAAGGGSIVNISSISGITGQHHVHVAYNASKGAVRTLTKAAAVQHGADNIRINSVHPGLMPPMRSSKRTADPEVRARMLRQVPMGRAGRVEEVANAALFLASDEASYITGAELWVDGGYLALSALGSAPAVPHRPIKPVTRRRGWLEHAAAPSIAEQAMRRRRYRAEVDGVGIDAGAAFNGESPRPSIQIGCCCCRAMRLGMRRWSVEGVDLAAPKFPTNKSLAKTPNRMQRYGSPQGESSGRWRPRRSNLTKAPSD
jgi:hypothetical protein